MWLKHLNWFRPTFYYSFCNTCQSCSDWNAWIGFILPFDFQNNDYIEYIIYLSICYRNIRPSVNNLVAHYQAKLKLQFGSNGHRPALLGLCMSLLASMCHPKMWYQTHDWWLICYCKWFDRTWLKDRAVQPRRSSSNKDDPRLR